MDINKPLSEGFSFAWSEIKSKLSFWLTILILLIFLQIINLFFTHLSENPGPLQLIGNLLSWVILIPIVLIQLGIARISLNAIDGADNKLTESFSQYKYLFIYLIATILYILGVAIGFLLLIVPGIIFASVAGLYPFIIIEENAGPIQAIRRSIEISRQRIGELVTFDFSIGILALIVAIPIVVVSYLLFKSTSGALTNATQLLTPYYYIATAHVYRKLKTHYSPQNINGDKLPDTTSFT
jgi:hypothetical protein